MYTIKFKADFPRITILHHIEPDGTVWGASGRDILKKPKASDKWEAVSQFPFQPKRDLLNLARPLARALRADKCNVYVNRQGNVLGIRSGVVYKIQAGGPPKPLFNIQGDTVLHGGMCEDEAGNMYFGEYYMNPSREEVRIWRVSADLSTWAAAYTFPAKSIRHIHGIYPDPYQDGAFWVATGDYEDECYFYQTSDNFQTLEQFGQGTQMWRAVRLFFTPTHVCWLTDSHLEQNFACRMERATGEIQVGQKIDASGWYGTTTTEGLHIAFTTVEPGEGIQTDKASILVSEDGFEWKTVHHYKKDFWRPMKVFKYGVISVPSGHMSANEVYISGEGLVGLDGRSALISIEAKHS